MSNNYEVQVWQEGTEWRAQVFVVDLTGQRVHELDGLPYHDYLLNTMNYVGQTIADHERKGGN